MSENVLINETQDERLKALFPEEVLLKWKQSCVMVCGIGGVGAVSAETLARCGIGHLILVDCDKVAVSNLNRQILSLHSTVGQDKTTALSARLKDINPDLKITVLNQFISPDNLADLWNLHPDFVIDAIDSFESKKALIEGAVSLSVPFISSMGAARKTDMSHVHVGMMNKTDVCPLARKMRVALKKDGFSLHFPCVYSTESAQKSLYGAKLGSFMPVTALFGLHAADYALKFLGNLK